MLDTTGDLDILLVVYLESLLFGGGDGGGGGGRGVLDDLTVLFGLEGSMPIGDVGESVEFDEDLGVVMYIEERELERVIGWFDKRVAEVEFAGED